MIGSGMSARSKNLCQKLETGWKPVPSSNHRIAAIEHFNANVVRKVFLGQRLDDHSAFVVKPFEFARLVLRQRVMRAERHGDGRVGAQLMPQIRAELSG